MNYPHGHSIVISDNGTRGSSVSTTVIPLLFVIVR